MENKKVLILFSGGIDSTATLLWYLKNTNYKIVALHLFYQISAVGFRQSREINATRNLQKQFQKIRKFSYVESYHHFANIPLTQDVLMTSLLSYPVAVSHKCTDIVLGYINDKDGQLLRIENYNQKLNQLTKIFADLNDYKFYSIYSLSEFYQSKFTYYKFLIDNNIDIKQTQYCRGKHYKSENDYSELPCGICYTCLQVKKIQSQLNT